jgi:hypothetical protein
MANGDNYKEIFVVVEINGKPINAIIDTGSNISLIHEKLIGDSNDKKNTNKFTVDFKKTVERKVTFMSGVGVSRDALVKTLKIKKNDISFSKNTVITIVDLEKTIPNFPKNIDMIIGTNAMNESIVKFEKSKNLDILSRKQLNGEIERNDYFEIDVIDTLCDINKFDALGPLFLVKIHNSEIPNTVFLADSGNKFSSFCLDSSSADKQTHSKASNAVCGVGLQCFECGNTNIQILVKDIKKKNSKFRPKTIKTKLQKIAPPASLTSIENWCIDELGQKIEIQGNLGIDFWGNFCKKSLFDFEKKKIYVVF